MKKIKNIICDCDDVLLEYRKGFLKVYPECENMYIFPTEKNKAFRMSEEFSNLPPCQGAVEFIKKVKSSGYKIDIVTSVGNEDGVREKRIRNLNSIFGEDAFNEIIVLSYFDSKAEVLSKLPKSFFIDDMAKNFIGSLHVNIHKNIEADNSQTPSDVNIVKSINHIEEALDFIINY